ncbi:uncharacterized protein BDR25DRAFT_348183 [Lindgomyces ingoldianus]|uniref:Uncharacterized protein n=1 Tax=Lindgomyces ingoldianus TaxID=673940 RepID=A0ACB6RF89_9PLEO|nr:uncharacterized protein BDR25DRAFT_348183 [Lindgomyces ingoldianus]KAF2477871.1 hypothetical protein BDR25DRAFT_348183 [Lindgomyces ingoldianus]
MIRLSGNESGHWSDRELKDADVTTMEQCPLCLDGREQNQDRREETNEVGDEKASCRGTGGRGVESKETDQATRKRQNPAGPAVPLPRPQESQAAWPWASFLGSEAWGISLSRALKMKMFTFETERFAPTDTLASNNSSVESLVKTSQRPCYPFAKRCPGMQRRPRPHCGFGQGPLHNQNILSPEPPLREWAKIIERVALAASLETHWSQIPLGARCLCMFHFVPLPPYERLSEHGSGGRGQEASEGTWQLTSLAALPGTVNSRWRDTILERGLYCYIAILLQQEGYYIAAGAL